VLQLTADHLQQIHTHAERTYPEECCGLLLGQFDRQQSQSRVMEVWPVVNAWSLTVAEELAAIEPAAFTGLKTAKTDRYWIDPQDLLKAQRYARDRHMQMIGIYHSHPDHPAQPSECDRRLAWAQYSYVIVSVRDGQSQATHCWNLDANHQFQAEELLIVPDTELD
jgi:proteasome lid subunit RPN8/RPN11